MKVIKSLILVLLLLLPVQSSTKELGVFHIISGTVVGAASVASMLYIPTICERHGEYLLGSVLFYTSIFTFVYGGFEIKVGLNLLK